MWLEGMNSSDLGIVVAGKHYIATQTMDEERRQNISYSGAFGYDGAIIRSVRKADEATISFSAMLLKPGQDAGMDNLNDEDFLVKQRDFQVLTRRGANNWRVYDQCSWSRVAVSSTLDAVTLSADVSWPQQ